MPEGSGDLFGSYQQYKHETSCVAWWLIENADIAVIPSQFKKGKKGTVKTRKALNKTLVDTIRPADYLRLVRNIVNQKPAVEVPSHLIDSLRDVIRIRKWFHSWFSSSQRSEDVQLVNDNNSHLHFIRILTETARLLSSSRQGSIRKAEKQPEGGARAFSQVQDNALIDQLKDLALDPHLNDEGSFVPSRVQEGSELTEDPAEEIDEEFAADPMRDEAPSGRFSYKCLFAYQCLLKDLYEMRDVVVENWKRASRNDSNAVIMASIMTNTAIDIATRLEENFNTTFKIASNEDFCHL
jgi:hypothetical protein